MGELNRRLELEGGELREISKEEYKARMEKLIEEKGFYGAVESICDVINEEYALPCDYLTCRGIQECLSDILFLVELRENDK
jgi:hypothetical protein